MADKTKLSVWLYTMGMIDTFDFFKAQHIMAPDNFTVEKWAKQMSTRLQLLQELKELEEMVK